MTSIYEEQLENNDNVLFQGISPLKEGLSHLNPHQDYPFKLSPFKMLGSSENHQSHPLSNHFQHNELKSLNNNDEFKLYHSNPKKSSLTFFDDNYEMLQQQQYNQQLQKQQEIPSQQYQQQQQQQQQCQQKQQYYDNEDQLENYNNIKIEEKCTAPDLEYPEQARECEYNASRTFSYEFEDDSSFQPNNINNNEIQIQEQFVFQQQQDLNQQQQQHCTYKFLQQQPQIHYQQEQQQSQQHNQYESYYPQQQQQQKLQQNEFQDDSDDENDFEIECDHQQNVFYQQYDQQNGQQQYEQKQKKQSRVYNKKKQQNSLKLNLKTDSGYQLFDIKDVTTAHVPTNIMNLLIPYLLTHFQNRNLTCLFDKDSEFKQCKISCTCMNCESYKYLRKLKVSKRNKNLRNFKQIWKNKYLRLLSEDYFLNQCAGELLAKKIQKNTNMIHRYSALMLIKKFVEGVREPENFIKLL